MSASNSSVGFGHNSGEAPLPTNAVLMEQVRIAIQEEGKRDALLGTSSQRMAYAIMCWHDGESSIATWESLFGSTEARSKLLTDFRAALSIEETTFAAAIEAVGDDKAADAKHNSDANKALLARGLHVAIVLARNSVKISAFNIKQGIFTVPGWLFVPRPSKPRAGSKFAGDVPMANVGFGYSGEAKNGAERTMNCRTRVKQLQVANPLEGKIKRGAQTPADEKKGSDKLASPPLLVTANGAPVADLIAELYSEGRQAKHDQAQARDEAQFLA